LLHTLTYIKLKHAIPKQYSKSLHLKFVLISRNCLQNYIQTCLKFNFGSKTFNYWWDWTYKHKKVLLI